MANKNIWVCVHTVKLSRRELQYNVNTHTEKMKHPITMYTIVELRVVVRFLCVRGKSATDIVRLLCDTYAADQLPDDLTVHRRRIEFLTSCTTLQDKVCRRRPSDSQTAENITRLCELINTDSWYTLVMGCIDENRYRYSIDTLAKLSIVSILLAILRYLSKNPHHELHIHKLVTYFNVFQLADFEFFWNFCFFWHLPHFYSVSDYFILDFFFGIFCHYSSDNTKYRYLNKVSILNDTKRYRYSTILKVIDSSFWGRGEL